MTLIFTARHPLEQDPEHVYSQSLRHALSHVPRQRPEQVPTHVELHVP